MQLTKPTQNQAFLGGLILGVVAMLGYESLTAPTPSPVPAKKDFHVHADFIVHLNGTELDFTADTYQSVVGDEKLKNFHLHDNEGNILHRHAENITLGEFFGSIGFTLTDDCIITDTGEEYCSNNEQELILFANGEPVSDPAGYVFNDLDRLLLYYGDPNNPDLTDYQELITDESCIYSGTCPERGTPPPESCGLTCDV